MTYDIYDTINGEYMAEDVEEQEIAKTLLEHFLPCGLYDQQSRDVFIACLQLAERIKRNHYSDDLESYLGIRVDSVF